MSEIKQTGVTAPLLSFKLSRMSHQIRPGARGGRDQFSWDQVKEDKQRLNYLGSSIHGMPDKFKRGPETFWYVKETKTIPEKSDKSEIELLKEKERLAMEALLGGGIKKKKVEVDHQTETRRDKSPNRTDRRSSSYSERHVRRDDPIDDRRDDRRDYKRYNSYPSKGSDVNDKNDYRGYRGYKESDRHDRYRESQRRYERSRSPRMYK